MRYATGYREKLSAGLSDGAALLLGKKNGVGKKLKDISPNIITSQCKDQGLALAC